MAYFTVEGLDGEGSFRCEGIGMPGQFFQQVMSQAAGLLQPSKF